MIVILPSDVDCNTRAFVLFCLCKKVKLEVTEEASEPLQERGTPFFNFSDVSMVQGFMQTYPGLSDYVVTNAQYHATPHQGPGRKKKPPNVPLPIIPGSYRTGPKHRKEFPCERCNEVFDKREDLRVHVMMHAGNRALCDNVRLTGIFETNFRC
jgi:hypothetical protein